MSAGDAKPFGGTIGKTIKDSKPWWPQAKRPPTGAPNILVVLFDDVGFSDFGCYGSRIRTLTIDRLAAEGLRYTGFHTTAMCSTTRAALLTGRNHHSVGVGCLANFDSGYPGYRGKIAKEAGTIAEILRAHGYRNYMVGKWHVTPLTESGATGPFDGWPLGRGFDRFYGFLDAETDQYAPELVSDNAHIDPPGTYETGYHLTADLIDQSIGFIADHLADRPDLPWLTWVALGACHAPHQAPADLIKSYDEMFSHGWDVERELRMARQKDMGVVPQETKMPARNDGVKAWQEHSGDERRVFTRMQSAFAGMLDHADQHLARLMAFLEKARYARQYAHHRDVRQWREPGGRAARFHQCDGAVQFPARTDAGEAAPDRRHRRPRYVQQFPARLGDGVEHAAAPLQAEHPWRRHS
jgi:arylsulfatase A-like enzyme